MKKIIYYFSILFTLLATACSNEDIPVPAQVENEGDTCELTFKVAIPQPSVVSRAFNDGSSIDITSLCLLLFDEDGILVGRQLATSVEDPTWSVEENAYQGTYSVELAKTDEKRIIHFVANYSNEINDFPSSGNENSVLSQLYVTNQADAYWQRMEVTAIKDTNNDDVADGIGTVRLIRNFAAVKMEMSKDKDEEDNYLVDQDFLQGYVLYNTPTKGTVAPYFMDASGGFANYTPGISYENLVNSPTDNTNSGQGYMGVEPQLAESDFDKTEPQDPTTNSPFTNAEKYTYERRYTEDVAKNPTFIIMKGKIGDNFYYYRVDIAENFKNLKLLRNFRYILQIKKTCEGYTTIADAIAGSSFNHLVDISIKVEEITDGETTLKVSPTDITVVNGTEFVSIAYTCTYDGEEGTAPTLSVSNPFTPEVNEERSIIESISEPNGLSGTLTVALKSFFKTENNKQVSDLSGGLEKQRFEVRTSNGLTRQVRINLIDKIDFMPKFVGPYPTDDLDLYQYQYTLPKDLPESMFPLEIYLYEETGSFTPASGEQLSVDLIDDPNNDGRRTWRYKKVMTYAEYINSDNYVETDDGKQFVAKFKGHGTISGEYTMTINNEYADEGRATLQEPTIITLSGTTLQNGTLTWYVGDTPTEQKITVALNKENVGYTLSTLKNFTVSDTNGTLTITPKSLDTALEKPETLVIRTNDDTATATVKLQIIKIDLSVTQVNLNPTTVPLGSGEDVTLTFNMNKVATLTIDAQRLTGASSSTGDVISNPDGTISYTPDDSGTQTITFKTADAVRGGTVTISHEEITSNELPYGRKWNNINVNNGNSNYVGEYKIKVGTTEIGSCNYEYSGGFFGIGSYSRLTDISIYDTYTGELQNDTIITITNGTQTINTTIGNLISGSNLSFSN